MFSVAEIISELFQQLK